MRFIIVLVGLCILPNWCYFFSNDTREAKFWPIGFVRFENAVCNSTSNLDGTCYTKRQCRSLNGVQSGRCASVGVCCVIIRSCGATSSYNNTYFVNTNFPRAVTGSTRCTMTIQKCNSDICQVRIDFLSLTLAQPDGEGNCVNDAMTITGGGSQVPIICGENSGDHVYVDFEGDNDIIITIATSAATTLSRTWNLKVSQIACACPTKAPSGCLKYYTEETGTFRSFNYGTTENTQLTSQNSIGTRELVNQNYGICIAMIPGYCSIAYSQSDTLSFTVSGDTQASAEIIGTPAASVGGDDCTTDFIIIAHPFVDGTALNYDRFCGNGLPNVVSFSKPFVVYVVNDGDESEGIANRGFSINYRQIRCSSLNTNFNAAAG